MAYEKYARVESVKQFFRVRNKDLFSVDTICAILDLFPEEDCVEIDVAGGFLYPNGKYKEIEDRIQREDNMNKVFFIDEKGPGGGYHEYIVINERTNVVLATLCFQKGPRLAKNSVQGVLDTDVLEIARHRLKAFVYVNMNDENTRNALMCVEGALGFLRRRTEDRKNRGVLGTMEK